eukprot:CAMPEP_0197713746 /NCGR_PEP_ID=MMETSP1338-20131121/130611_1 /TAXON_ID=43686 ORGANISM="Pelagodinium beii, Strain RCC1491" /NCGR_SAMPLE_ID=MMETSP1338 /ASSEMBLY_ACC=CAM_ASM_000754 /LENGTH=71 /DNA_ID=CAMNT_0043297687 /DNA_START=810 /DNA_END=1025 /DNA_ORIENTATION=+
MSGGKRQVRRSWELPQDLASCLVWKAHATAARDRPGLLSLQIDSAHTLSGCHRVALGLHYTSELLRDVFFG